MQTSKKKPSVIFLAFGALLAAYLGYLVGGAWEQGIDLMSFMERFNSVCAAPFANYFNENTVKTVAIVVGIYAMAVLMYYTSQRNYMPGKEYGTARFENPQRVNSILMDKDENFNRILSQNVKMSLDFRRLKLNGNILICGGSGAGKTFYEVKPNLMQMPHNCSFICTDPKGEILRSCGQMLKDNGYNVKVINLLEMDKSDCYNPFSYIREETDIVKLIESDIIKQQRVRNKNNDFSSEISYAKRTEKKEIEAIMDDVRENDQCLFYVGVTIILMADSKKELESITETVETIGKRNSCTIDVHYLKQREALNTALPIGVRQVETMRTMLTQSLAVLMPFNVQELNDEGGVYYGINQVSKNINIGNRKKLINGNGFVFGVPGSGKSFFCKAAMGQVFLSTDDEIIIIDPMNEYFDIATTYGGTVINMSTYTDNYVNPLAMDVWNLDQNDTKGWVREKGEFMLGLCEQCIGDSLNSRQKSIIDRCVRKMYIDIARSREKYIPVMSDFYDILMAQPEEEAKEIALSLELFVNGSLNIFNHQTNVDVDNRFVVYGIRDLGTELSPITMLVMMESIQQRIVENGKRGKATWLYIDEFHVLLNSEYSAKYLQQLWKKVRKQGGLCTGITQNVVDLLQNYTATTMLANSEFVALLKQANTDSSKMAEVIGVSDAQLRFVTNSQSGMGLLKCGNVVIPFDNQIGKDTSLYKLYNTNIHEKIAEQRAKENHVSVV